MAATKSITKMAATLLLVLVALAAVPGTEAQAPAESPVPVPAGTFECVNELINMSDCLTFVEAGSKLSEPEKACCPELAGMVETKPVCLCQLLADPENVIGIKIELKKALNLPSFCKLNTPSTSLCSAIGIPVGAPTAGKFPSSPGGGNPHDDSAAIRSSVALFLQKSSLLGLAIMGFAALF
ncbi:PREDICTED: non-specific lipid transfer protein GPI-anchored 2-like [Ipomoea nil]|uniref:non-specific lipid transfer protein GPI-anchored 2-like n=1 Tax=Ipomoea nil TaxID=35883 RepID=UPI000900C153|nr:PREDICTED: non-specific lipid transfer protein GPI-anchored 2-like [Ipomoea nil]